MSTDGPEEYPIGPIHQIGPIVIEGEDPPKWLALVYFGPVLVAALGVGIFGPFHGWAAVVAAIGAAVLTYLLVAILVLGSGLAMAIVRGYRDKRAFERDPRAFMQQRMRNRRPEPPPGPPTSQG